MDFHLEHLEMEFEAETWWFCSTHGGYKTTKFQLQTPSRSAPTENPFYPKNFFFSRKKWILKHELRSPFKWRAHLSGALGYSQIYKKYT